MAPRLKPSIKPADRSKYDSVRDGTDWANPYLIVRQDGIEILSKFLSPTHELIPVGNLQQTLLALPVDAWPYGKVVAVQDPSIAGDNPTLQEQNRAQTERILTSLNIEMELWPSA